VVVALAVPVGFALSLEPAALSLRAPQAIVASERPALPSVRPLGSSQIACLDPVPDGVKLFVVGTMLFGLAALVRRAG